MDPVVEDAEVRLRRTAAGAEDEGDVGVIGSDRTDRLLVAEGVAEDDVRGVLLGGLAQHALHVAGVADVIGEGVLDAAGLLPRPGARRGSRRPTAPRSGWRYAPKTFGTSPSPPRALVTGPPHALSTSRATVAIMTGAAEVPPVGEWLDASNVHVTGTSCGTTRVPRLDEAPQRTGCGRPQVRHSGHRRARFKGPVRTGTHDAVR